jgi:hypothetical protein
MSKEETVETVEEDRPLLELMLESGSLPVNKIFNELAREWIYENRSTSIELSDYLGIKPQSCSQWKTGSDGRKPTWTAMLTLAKDLKLEIVINPDEMFLKKKSRRKAKK